MKQLFTLILLVTVLVLKSQTIQEMELRLGELPAVKNDSARLSTCLYVMPYVFARDPQLLDSLLNEGETIARRHKKMSELAELEVWKSRTLSAKGDYTGAQALLQSALKTYKEKDDKGRMGFALAFYGMTQAMEGKLTDASLSFEEGQKLLDPTHCHEEPFCSYAQGALISNSMALYYFRNDKEGMEVALKRAERIAEKMKKKFPQDWSTLTLYSVVKGNLGLLQRERGELDEALELLEETVDAVQQLKDYQKETTLQGTLAEVYFSKKEFERSLNHLDQSIANRLKYNILNQIGDDLILRAQINRATRNWTAATNDLKEAIAYSSQQNNYTQLRNAYKEWALLDSLRGDYKASLEHYQQYTSFKDSLLNETTNRTIEEANAKYKAKEREAELALEKQKSAELKNVQTIGFAGGGLLFLLLGGAYFFQRSQRKKEAEKMQLQLENSRLEQEKINLALEQKKKDIEHKNKELIGMARHLQERNEMMEKLEASLAQEGIDSSSIRKVQRQFASAVQNGGTLEQFSLYLDEASQDFFYALNQLNASLSENEKRLCALVRLEFATKDIAAISGVSLSAIRTAKHRLKKKLPLEENETFEAFLQKL